jgi:hypothetical protein
MDRKRQNASSGVLGASNRRCGFLPRIHQREAFRAFLRGCLALRLRRGVFITQAEISDWRCCHRCAHQNTLWSAVPKRQGPLPGEHLPDPTGACASWEMPTMATVPAACMTCGAVFWMRLPFGGASVVELRSNVTNCPICGGWAQIADGLFQFTRDGLAVISAPDVTHQMLAALHGLLHRAYEQDLPVEEIKRQAEAISPGFGRLFDPTTWSPEVKSAVIGALAAVLIAWMTLRQEPVTVNVNSIDPAPLIDAIRQMSTEQVLRGDADERIAEAARSRMLGPPRLKPDNATRSARDPKTDRLP